MITRFRAWLPDVQKMLRVKALVYEEKTRCVCGYAYDFYIEDENAIIMQSTGLKDKNGQEIFEGDIVSDGYDTGDIKNHETLGFYMVDKKGIECWFSDGATIEDFEEYVKTAFKIIEVIGNIYENPELLEADHDRD